eukprot:s1405_g7.t1
MARGKGRTCGRQTESDSWCLACSSLELAQSFFKKRWLSPGVRAVAEETVLSSARVVRALYNLDGTLPTSSGSSPRAELRQRSQPERRRSRTPRRDERPPIVRRAPSKEAPAKEKEKETPQRESDDSEESEEEEPEKDKEVEVRQTEVKREEREESPKRTRESEPAPDREVRHPRGSERPAHPEHPPRQRSHHHSDKTQKKKRKRQRKNHRGGTRHQRHDRELDNPFRASHRRLSGEQLELAKDLETGLSRRH